MNISFLIKAFKAEMIKKVYVKGKRLHREENKN